jgi:hypothetical protein
MKRTKARDFTLRGLVAELAERGLKVDVLSPPASTACVFATMPRQKPLSPG